MTTPVLKNVSVSVDVIKKTADDVLVAENQTEEITTENAEDVFDVIRDTTSLKDKLLADASNTNKKDSNEDAYTQPTGTFSFDDFLEDEPRRKRRPISIGLFGSTSDSPIMKVLGDFAPGQSMGDQVQQPEHPDDSLSVEAPEPVMAMMRTKSGYYDSYSHEIPLSFGVSARIHFTDRL